LSRFYFALSGLRIEPTSVPGALPLAFIDQPAGLRNRTGDCALIGWVAPKAAQQLSGVELREISTQNQNAFPPNGRPF